MDYSAFIQRPPTAALLSVIFFAAATPGSRADLAAALAEEPAPGRLAGQATRPAPSPEPGLLFHLSGDDGFIADFAAGGQRRPNYLRDVTVIADGAHGPGFQAEDPQLMAYWAPGNIYAQRGTLSFFWRSRYPVGPTEFPIFRVGYADHNSWDMVWLRIDYNGRGFDAFVTDIGLTRTRVSHFMDEFPEADEWTHLALAWDETEGIRLYVNGELVATQSITGMVYDTGLDQFGPHSRIISPYQVQSRYNFMRGGDIDEIRIYDRMLSDENIAALARGESTGPVPDLRRDLRERRWRDAWWTRHGWNLPSPPPPRLPGAQTAVRKVEIHDAYDIQRWYWKANDGIRETTWPGVYNMSRLPGRYDYFVLPDWDCYSLSGRSVTFTLPDEPWNHIEVWGKAWGQFTRVRNDVDDHTFAVRTRHQVKSFHRLESPETGGRIRYDNALIEEPIGSFMVYHVTEGSAPAGTARQDFLLTADDAGPREGQLNELTAFIHGRYPVDERRTMVGVREGDRRHAAPRIEKPEAPMPFIHILIPYADEPGAGLDGVLIELPGLAVLPTHGDLFPLNVRIKDPLWPMRDLADFSFSVRPNEPRTLWFDTRDRILPPGRGLYITLAGAGADLAPGMLEGAKVRLVFKSRIDALAEHELDRFTQVRDIHAHNVEEGPRTPRLNSYNRYYADLRDLLDVNPDHWLAQTYWYWVHGNNKPHYEIPKGPDEVPEWAFLQTEFLRRVARLILYYIDNRQIENGEFGGGLSDDGDLTNLWPGAAFLGIEPDRLLESLLLHMEAYYHDRPAVYHQPSLPLFTNGLSTIITDELHAYEEGIQVVAQLQTLDYGAPLHMVRGMETARRLYEDITRINPYGHRLFRSRYYSGTRIATDDPWQWTDPNSYIVLHPAFMILRHNGNPRLGTMVLEIADALLARFENGNLRNTIHWETGESVGTEVGRIWPVFFAAYRYSGDPKYLAPIPGADVVDRTFDPDMLAQRYRGLIEEIGIREYINTEGSIWIDRVNARVHHEVQEDRLGGVALVRLHCHPQHYVSWRFHGEADFDSAAIFIPRANPRELEVIAFNLETEPVHAAMTVWDVEPGLWRVEQGVDANDDRQFEGETTVRRVNLERGESLNLVLPPRQTSIVRLRLEQPAETGYWERPDLGVGRTDVRVKGHIVEARVHNLGAVDAPASVIALKDGSGRTIAVADIPPIKAPLDLRPKFADITLVAPPETDFETATVVIDPENRITEITRKNNRLSLRYAPGTFSQRPLPFRNR